MMTQMKVFGLLIIVGLFGVAPVVVFESVVMPQIINMYETYANFDQVTEDVAAGEQISTYSLR